MSRVLIVPGEPNKSYFFFITRGISAEEGDPPFSNPPANVGLMPQKGTSICCQKIDAIYKISIGAPELDYVREHYHQATLECQKRNPPQP